MRKGLNYSEFIDELVSELNEKSTDISFKKVFYEKMNNPYEGIQIQKEGLTTMPVLNPKEIYEDYLSTPEEGLDDIVDATFHLARSKAANTPNMDFLENITYGDVVQDIFPQMVNYERNQELLKNVPYKRYEDLAMIYRIDLSAKMKDSTTVITKQLLQRLDVTTEELHEDALLYGSQYHPAKMKRLGDYMLERFDVPKEVAEASNQLHIVTNDEACYGASAIFYPDVMKKMGETLGGDYVILPSSIHEVLLRRINVAEDPNELKQVVQSINRDVVQSQDFLSDNIYCYDAEDDQFGSIDWYYEKHCQFDEDNELENEIHVENVSNDISM